MKLSQCKLGVLVQHDTSIGHVVCLTKNVCERPEVIPVVHFAGEEKPRGIHHNNLKLYED